MLRVFILSLAEFIKFDVDYSLITLSSDEIVKSISVKVTAQSTNFVFVFGLQFYVNTGSNIPE